MSVLDGWWPEGYRGDNGWAIGKGEVYEDIEYQNEIESRAVYDLLEKEVVPLFYDRGGDGIPRGWLARMKASIESLCPVFSTERMLQEYTDSFYLPAFESWKALDENHQSLSRELAGWKEKMRRLWGQARVEEVEASIAGEIPVGAHIRVQVSVVTGEIPVEELSVTVYSGILDAGDVIVAGEETPLTRMEQLKEGLYRFSGEVECRVCGRLGFAVRIMPKHPRIGPLYEPGMIIWA